MAPGRGDFTAASPWSVQLAVLGFSLVGTGRAGLEAFREARANSLVRANDAHGLLERTLLADSWSFRFVDVAGTVRDQGTGLCH